MTGSNAMPKLLRMPYREDLLEVLARLAADRLANAEERVVGRRAAVVVEAQDQAGQVRVVGFGSAELVVLEPDRRAKVRRTSASGRTAGSAAAAAAVVAHDHVELAVGTEADHAAVVVAGGGLPRVALAGRLGRAVGLKRAQ